MNHPMQEPLYVGRLQDHTFQVKDESKNNRRLWFTVEDRHDGIWITAYKEHPTRNTPETQALFTVKVELFNNKGQVLIWPHDKDTTGEEGPSFSVIREDIDGWKPLEEKEPEQGG